MNSKILRNIAILLAGLAFAFTAPSRATVLISQDEALVLAIPGATWVRHTAYLKEEQLQDAREKAGRGVEFLTTVVPYYVATKDGSLHGVAYFDTHIVRSKAETVMIVVNPSGQIVRLEVIAFDEPPEYRPRPAWLRQFDGEALTGELALKKAIHPMAGGTLTAHAIVQASRRVLALHEIISPIALEETR